MRSHKKYYHALGKLSNIPESYANMLLEDIGVKKRKPYHEQRANTCHECSDGANTCPECGCPLKALISGPKNNCDLNKWEQ